MATEKRRSQTNRVLDLLQGRRGDWIPAYQVAEVGGLQYGGRVHTLRQLGHVITNRVEYHNGQVVSWFKLESSQEPPVPTPMAAPAPAFESESLFGDVSPDRSYRE